MCCTMNDHTSFLFIALIYYNVRDCTVLRRLSSPDVNLEINKNKFHNMTITGHFPISIEISKPLPVFTNIEFLKKSVSYIFFLVNNI